MIRWNYKILYMASSLFFCISKSQKILCVSFSRTDSGLCIYYLVWSNFNFLHNFQWITFPTQSCLFLYSFYTSFLQWLIMRLIMSSLSPHNLHSVAYYQFHFYIVTLFWFMLLQEIKFLSKCFSFETMSASTGLKFCQFVTRNIRTVVLLPIFVF